MIFRKMTLLIFLLTLPLTSMAQESIRTYTIKKGDTLWGISERFIKDPFYWPNLWANNPFVTNPHFIYPGQKVNIYDGRIEIVPALPVAETVPAEVPEVAAPSTIEPPVPALPEPQKAITIKTQGGAEGFVTTEELDSFGTLVDTVDNRILMAVGDVVFLQMDNPTSVSPGDSFSLFELSKEVEHPVTGEPLGYQVVSLGAVKIKGMDGEVATAVITVAHQEIQRGAKLRAVPPAHQEVELKKSASELSGYVVAAQSDKIALGQHDVIYLDLGSEDGLAEGNLLYISRHREATELALEKDLKLPEVLLGSAVVLETRPHTAAALVLKSADAMYRGDKVYTAVE